MIDHRTGPTIDGAIRPAEAGSFVRRAYEPWQKVYSAAFWLIVKDVDVEQNGRVSYAVMPQWRVCSAAARS